MVNVENNLEQMDISEEAQLSEECNPSVLTNTNLFTIPEEEEPLHSPAADEIDIPPEESDHLEIDVLDDIVIRPQVNNAVVETCEEQNHAVMHQCAGILEEKPNGLDFRLHGNMAFNVANTVFHKKRHSSNNTCNSNHFRGH